MKLTTKKVDALVHLYASGMTYQHIADVLGVQKSTLTYWLRQRRDACPRRTHDEGWWREQLSEWRALPASVLARKLGCNRCTVYKWRKRLGM